MLADVHSIEVLMNAVALALPRFIAVLAILPLFSRQQIPPLARAMVAAVFALPLLPVLVNEVRTLPPTDGMLLLLMVKETAVGLLLGITVAVPFWAVEAIGFLIDNQRGASVAGMVNPGTGSDSSPLGLLLAQSYAVLFLMLGGLPLVLALLYESYRIWPATAPLPRFHPEFGRYVLQMLDAVLRTALVLAAPAMIAMFLAEIGLALISLFAPQMQVFFLAMPVKSGVALFVLVVYCRTLFDYLIDLAGSSKTALTVLTTVFR